MFWLYLIILLAYACALVAVLATWLSIKGSAVKSTASSVSVVVPYRNEAQRLEKLISALDAQEYPHFEVLFINDHSTDTSEQVLEGLLRNVKFAYQTLSLSQACGKKAAISRAVVEARGEIILTTDADCWFGKNWVRCMAGYFNDQRAQLVSGPVVLTGKSLFQRWQQMEFSVLIVTGAAGIQWKKPSMANGANLGYRKSAFQAVKGFEGVDGIASGDDELLMMKIHQKYAGGLCFAKNKNATVKTDALASWPAFKNQRLRWAGKWRFGRRPTSVAGALAVFVFNLSFLLLPLAAISGVLSWWQMACLLGGRLLTELILVLAIRHFFRFRLSAVAFLLHQILYPFYAVFFGLAANFGKYQWKGRSYKARAQ
jgi:cellulose synthase/poly-beta-1,6-N-acetylglucosamine synthase-like glycosyltransferase